MAFHVPFAMLLGANDKATGEFTEATIVPLDNDDYPYMNGKKLLTLLASVNRLSTAADSRMGIVKPAKSIIPPPLPIPSADDATGIRADGSLTNSQGAENSTEAKTRDLTGDVQHLAKVIRDTKGDEVGAAWVQDNLDAILILKAEIVDWLYAIDVNNPANQSIAA
jgi:hypothetical protein